MIKTQNYPTVSVIIPTYNRRHLIGRAIKSILNQNYQDFEIIVVDDGSTDNTEEVVKNFNDKRIKYIRHEKNKGAAAARNTGIKIAKGEYIAFQDSDDEWLSEKLDKQMDVFENAPARVGVVYTGFWRIKGRKKTYMPSFKITRKEGNIYNRLLRGNFVSTHVVIKKGCFKKTGIFDESLPRLQDWELFIRISKYYHFKCIDEPLVISYYTPDSISADQNALIRAIKLISEKHYEEFKNDRRSLSSHQGWIGSLLCESGKMAQGRRCLFKAIRLYPWNIKCLAALFASFFGSGIYNRLRRI